MFPDKWILIICCDCQGGEVLTCSDIAQYNTDISKETTAFKAPNRRSGKQIIKRGLI